MITSPATQFIKRCQAVSSSKPLLVIAGSGISCPYPAMLPSAGNMVSRVIRHLAPAGAVDSHIETITDILPELYYEILEELFGREILEVWQCLTFWERHPALQSFPLGPTLSHYVLLYLAWKSRLPLITPNYDTLFETAARRVGLSPHVFTPGGRFSCAVQKHEIAIWKIHGSVCPVETSDQVYSTLRMITISNEVMLQTLRSVVQEKEAGLFLIGYSGRDIDFYPFLCSWPWNEPLYWIDRSFSTDEQYEHMSFKTERAWAKSADAARDNHFLRIQGTGDAIFADLLACWPSHANKLQKRIREIQTQLITHRRTQPATIEDDVTKARDQLVDNHCASIIQSVSVEPSDPRRLLAFVQALRARGANHLAEGYLSQFLDLMTDPSVDITPQMQCRALMVRSALDHEFCRYVDGTDGAYLAYVTARQAVRSEAWRSPMMAEACMAMSEAMRMRMFARLHFHDAVHYQHIVFWVMFIKALAILVIYRFHPWQRQKHYAESHDARNAAFHYVEHCIRFLSMVQGGMQQLRWPGKRIEWLVKPFWEMVYRRSQRIGYAKGIGNIQKYCERAQFSATSQPILSRDILFELLKDETGQAIALRDIGYQLLREGADSRDNAMMLEGRKVLVTKAIPHANMIGDPSLALKCHILLYLYDASYRVPRDQFDQLMTAIQGEAYRRIEEELRQAITC
ncbi:MAG: SIR2 family protein [Armatimonadota bacterium]